MKIVGIVTTGLLHCFTFLWCGNLTELFSVPNYVYSSLAIIILIFLFTTATVELFRNKETPFENISATLFGLFYTVIPFCLFHFIAIPNAMAFWPFEIIRYEPKLVFGLFLLIWSNDTFAYLVGSFIGKNKMFERISPGKTWEGTIGGAILTIGFSWFFQHWFGILTSSQWFILGGIVAIFGTIGDLIESMLKRSAGVKDSGTIMPGHGGILDRFDSLIYILPLVFIYLLFT